MAPGGNEGSNSSDPSGSADSTDLSEWVSKGLHTYIQCHSKAALTEFARSRFRLHGPCDPFVSLSTNCSEQWSDGDVKERTS